MTIFSLRCTLTMKLTSPRIGASGFPLYPNFDPVGHETSTVLSIYFQDVSDPAAG